MIRIRCFTEIDSSFITSSSSSSIDYRARRSSQKLPPEKLTIKNDVAKSSSSVNVIMAPRRNFTSNNNNDTMVISLPPPPPLPSVCRHNSLPPSPPSATPPPITTTAERTNNHRPVQIKRPPPPTVEPLAMKFRNANYSNNVAAAAATTTTTTATKVGLISKIRQMISSINVTATGNDDVATKRSAVVDKGAIKQHGNVNGQKGRRDNYCGGDYGTIMVNNDSENKLVTFPKETRTAMTICLNKQKQQGCNSETVNGGRQRIKIKSQKKAIVDVNKILLQY